MLIYDHAQPKIIKVIFSLSEFEGLFKINSIHQFIHEIQQNVRVPHPFLTALTQKLSKQLLHLLNLYQQTTNQLDSFIHY